MSDDLIFEVIDRDADKLTIETADAPDVAIYVQAAEDGVYLTTAEVDALRAALAPYGTPATRQERIDAIVRLVYAYGDTRAARTAAATADPARWDRSAREAETALGAIVAALDSALTRPEPPAGTVASEVWDRLTVIPSSELLDARRVAALEKAAEAAGRGAFGSQSHEAVLGYAMFLLAELPKAAA